jgi:hypothetical protein
MTIPDQISPSSNKYLDALQWGGWRWNDGSFPGTTITYFFRDGTYGEIWLSFEEAAYRAALQAWANVAALSFVEVFNYNSADLVEDLRGSASYLGWHETPEDAFLFDGKAWGEYVHNGEGWTTSGLQVGGLGFVTIVHEIGHALGLAHPHDTGGGSGRFPGVTSAFGDYGDNNLNQGIFTVMSYNDGWAQVQDPFGAGLTAYGYVAGPMAFDIAAIQYLYGPNNTYHAGNDVYVLPDTNAPGTYWTCIWDAGGVDNIVYNGTRDCTIDLTAATLDNSPTGGGVPSYASGIYGGFTIANSVVIEHVQSGSGDDTLVGNNAANILLAGAGNDWLAGDAGNDTLNGNQGFDIAAFSGSSSQYSVERLSFSQYGVVGPDGSDTVAYIESLQFSDNTISLVAPGIDYEGAALAVYLAMNSAPPNDATIANLIGFETTQYDYGSSIGVSDPLIYMWQALGQALCEGAASFASSFGPLALQQDATFAMQAYEATFGFSAGQAQVDHFVQQVNYFESIYTESGAYGTDPARIDLLARGAVYGQMLGISAEMDFLV